ncbi:helix-turn-helix transcriptional regulator [Rothia koreensis]|uniref:helix-turn-helix domain-containing protein n=1 Tax=Rothia koreensis TaxID=592378 RepID=UPI003F227DE8
MRELTIEAVLGANIKAQRERLGLTLSDVSKSLRWYGVHWSTGRLGDIEAGRGTASIQVVAMVALVLSDATPGFHDKIRPLDLLKADEPVKVGADHAMLPEYFNELMEDGLDGGQVALFTNAEDRIKNMITDMTATFEGVGPGVSISDANEAFRRFSDVDYRNAHRLGIERNAYIGACLRLWGRLLSDETEACAPEGASAQKKGRITRVLLDQLRGQIRVDSGTADPAEYETITVPESLGKVRRKEPKTFKRYLTQNHGE